MKKLLRIVGIVVGILILGVAIAWFGFLKPEPPPISEADLARLQLVPLPAKGEYGSGSFDLAQGISVGFSAVENARMNRAFERTVKLIEKKSGISITKTESPNLLINCTAQSPEYPELGIDESYVLSVTSNQIKVIANSEVGVIYALETLVQLLEYENGQWILPEISIEDSPRYPWRGLMVDVCRHWIPKDVIMRTLDAMASVKMNVLHLHLTEYQGFRVESKKFPKLHELGSEGDYYTQKDIKEMVDYAADRGIRVVPEFDLPGHSTSWLVGYPELGSAPGPYELDSIFGILEPVIDPTREEVYDFLDGFFEEMITLFPDEYLHIGGDEVNATQWKENENIQEFMRENEFLDEHALQAYFNQRLQKMLSNHDKKMMGWDEIIHPELPKEGVAVQSWRSPVSLWEAARDGNKAVLSSGYYLDYKQPASYHYGVDPLVIPGAIDIDIDSSNWKGWDVTMYFNETEMEGSMYIFGPENQQGIMSFMDANQGFEPEFDGDQLKFTHSTNFGEVSYDLKMDEDSISGTMSIAVFSLELKGKRTGGTDMSDGAPLPEFKKIEPLTPEQQMNILGGEACMWSEMVDATTIESRMWPRAAAVAEKLWSPQELTNNTDDFNRRYLIIDEYLTLRGSRHRNNTNDILSEILEPNKVGVVSEFVALLQEDKFFNRMSLYGESGLSTRIPLKRIVDAAPAESLEGLKFKILVQRWIETQSPDDEKAIRERLNRWSELSTDLPLDHESLKEVAQHVIHLEQLSKLGIDVLDGKKPDRSRTGNLIAESSKAYGATLLGVSEGFGLLLN